MLLIEDQFSLTVSNKDDVMAALVTPPVLMFARTGAPNPIDESWRLQGCHKYLLTFPFSKKGFIFYHMKRERVRGCMYVKPFRNGLLQINKGTPTYEKNILCVDLLKKLIIRD